MAVSNTISTTTFNTRRIIDNAVRRCRLPAQSITAETQHFAQDALYYILSDLANTKTPSWCIEKQIYPMYENQQDITLDVGTVDVLNANYRSLQSVDGTITDGANYYLIEFEYPTIVSTFGIKWAQDSVPLALQVSDDGSTWNTVYSLTTPAVSGDWVWVDVYGALAYQYFRVATPSGSTFLHYEIFLGNTPTEIPMGPINRDTYVAQSNKTFAGRPVNYWLQRDRTQPVMHLWPAPNVASEHAQIIVWRHRHIMDVGTLQQEIEVPQRWLEAITDKLALKIGQETPQVDVAILPMLTQNAVMSLQRAWDGDNDGSPTFIQPWIAPYTR